jgi:hypothetical protein
LPNLFCGGLLVVSWVLAIFLLEETHPLFKRVAGRDPCERKTLLAKSDKTNAIENELEMQIKARKQVGRIPWQVIISGCILTTHNMMFIQSLPIFLRSSKDSTVPAFYWGGIGGLKLPLAEVGLIMGLNGGIGLLFQLLFPSLETFLGVRTLFNWSAFVQPLIYLAIPYLAFVSGDSATRGAIYFCLTIRSIISAFQYLANSIMISRATSDPLMLGKVNGISASSMAACRTFAPALIGFWSAWGKTHHVNAVSWWIIGLVGIIGVFQSQYITNATLGEHKIVQGAGEEGTVSEQVQGPDAP